MVPGLTVCIDKWVTKGKPSEWTPIPTGGAGIVWVETERVKIVI